MTKLKIVSRLPNRSIVVLLVASVFIFLRNYAIAADVLCQVSDLHDPTLNVRDTPGGTVVNRLQNERIVQLDETKADTAGRKWAHVEGDYHGEFRDWGWVLRDSLRCVDSDQFPRERVSVGALARAGILSQHARRSGKQAISCDVVPNGWGVDISNELYEAYRRRGFSKTAVCLALGGDDVFFDPATGQRLNLYELPGALNGPRPIWLPDCYRQIQIVGTMSMARIFWRPTGCTVQYHPSTGLPVSKPEFVELSSGGEAGGGLDEDNQSSTVSEDRLQGLVNGK
jgi:hypothetical protein